MKGLILVLTGLLAGGTAMAAEVALTLRDRAGRPRVAEPVRIGVPLPKGAAADADQFTLLDADGTPIPCQFTPVCRWLGDETIKWVHLDFVTDCDSGAARTLTLSTDAGKNPPPTDPVVVEAGDGTITVKTAGMAVRLRGGRFNFLDRVTIDGKDVVTGGEAGIVLLTDAGAFSAVHDAAGTVAVESAGPIRALVRCEGTLKNADGEPAFDYIVRFAFHAGLRRVAAQFTYINRQGTRPADRQEMRDLSILIPTAAPAGANAAVGTAKGHAAASPQPGQALSIFQTTSDRYTVFTGADSSKGQLNRWAGKFLERGPGKQTKPLTTGWGGYAWPEGGIAAGWRWFWQMHPSLIELRGDGLMRLGLFPREGHESLPIYMGQARTHDLTLVFGPQEPEALNALFAGVQMPLRPFPEAKYLCRDSAAFGLVGESDPKLYGPLWDRLETYDRSLRDTLANHLERVDGALYRERRPAGEATEHTKGYWIDGYGFQPWGDVILWLYMNEEYPWTNSWSGNYYDFAFACLVQWMRTGDEAYLDQVEPSAIHEADVFTVNHHPRPSLIGACRYCPPRNHIGVDASPSAPYVSLEFNHHKAHPPSPAGTSSATSGCATWRC